MGRDWVEIGWRLGRDWGEIGERLGRDWGEIGESLGRDWVEIGDSSYKILVNLDQPTEIMGLTVQMVKRMSNVGAEREMMRGAY